MNLKLEMKVSPHPSARLPVEGKDRFGPIPLAASDPGTLPRAEVQGHETTAVG